MLASTRGCPRTLVLGALVLGLSSVGAAAAATAAAAPGTPAKPAQAASAVSTRTGTSGPTITTTDLGAVAGTVKAVAVDARGQVSAVGSVPAPAGSGWSSLPFVWRDGVGTTLPLPPHAPASSALPASAAAVDVNAAGQVLVSAQEVAGMPPRRSWSAVWTAGSYTPVAADLSVSALNGAGAVAGGTPDAHSFSCGRTYPSRPVVWNQDASWPALPGLLGPDAFGGRAADLDDRGRAVGWSHSAWARQADPVCAGVGRLPHAVLWSQGRVQDLGTLGGPTSEAVALDETGRVAGTSDTADGQRRAFVWRDGRLTDLGTLGGASSSAAALNGAGQVVGASTTASGTERAFLWQDGVMTDLGALGGGSSRALAVTDDGLVVGTSVLPSGETHLVTWTTPRAATVALQRLRTSLAAVPASTGLVAKVGQAITAVAAHRDAEACTVLSGLSDQLRRPKAGLTKARAAALVDEVGRIRSTLRCR